MQTYRFESMGTGWSIAIDHDQVPQSLWTQLHETSREFDHRFSRFIADSEVSQFRQAAAGTYQVSPLLAELLTQADQLRSLTSGKFDPAIGGLLEKAGYDPTYSFKPQNETDTFSLPRWSIEGQALTIDGPVVLDLGGTGKGFWIDQLAQQLRTAGFESFIVDGGGDMMATHKRDGSAWRVALEWPGEADRAIGVVELQNQGLAVSDVFKRRWGNWHHLVDVAHQQPVQRVAWAAAVSPSACLADCMTSVLTLCSAAIYATAAQQFSAQYLVISSDNQLHVSPNWTGELF